MTGRHRLPPVPGARFVAIALLVLAALPCSAPCAACDLAVLFVSVSRPAVCASDHAGADATRVSAEATLATPDRGVAIGDDPMAGDMLPAFGLHPAAATTATAAAPALAPVAPVRSGHIVLLPLRL